MSLKEYVAKRFEKIIVTETGPETKHDILVLLGVAKYLDQKSYSDNIVDAASFGDTVPDSVSG